MDKLITNPQKDFRIFKEFEYIDLIPYSIALLMVYGLVELVASFCQLINQLQ